MKIKAITVSQLNNYISNYVLANPIFLSLCIEGEIFNVKKTSYGYTFLSLKDEESKLNCIIFESQFDFKDEEFKEGDYVLAYGKINFYKKNGTYSLVINRLEKKGSGISYEKLKLLYEQFKKLGYFDESHKQEIVKYPENIGVITSIKGAAVKDIISVIKRKFPKVNLYIYNAKMQGKDTIEKVISGIEYLNALEVDTIIISRGGGDSDDLSMFNEEEIIKAIYKSKVPIISAIGHEIDFVLSDYVSDLRAPTPSVAGELSVPTLENVYKLIENLKSSIEINYKNIIKNKQIKLDSICYDIKNNSPSRKIENNLILINNYKNKIQSLFSEKIRNYENKLIYINSLLNENNISRMLSKGYCITTKDNELVSSIKSLNKKDNLIIQFFDGSIEVEVKDIRKKERDGQKKQ